MSTLPTSSATRKKRKRSKLIEHINSGNVDKIIKLVSNLDPNFVDEQSGETPLGLAACATSQQTITAQRVIVALVNGGALLDFRNKEGKTCLHTAVAKNNFVALKTFLDLGASPNFRDTQGLTPLFLTVLTKSNPKLTQLLLHEHSVHGIRDQHGWSECHHACKLGLNTHLEQLLYYGADSNARIGGSGGTGSGNTPLHVCAINDQTECARVLLTRGCDTSVVNNSHQNPYQVAVIAGNLALAELIKGHRPENVQPYRDKPKYNPARRPVEQAHHQQLRAPLATLAPGATNGCCPASPCLSQRSCATNSTLSSTTTGTTASSTGCCSEMTSATESACESDTTGFSAGGHTSCTSEDEISAATCRPARVEGRREQKLAGVAPAGSASTMPIRGRRGVGTTKPNGGTSPTGSDGSSPSSGSDKPPPITSYTEKTVSLHRGNKGFGFVLRGAKATSPVARSGPEKAMALQPISVQYLDEIETGGVAEAAGLAKGDFLLNVNGVDVRSAAHEQVVQLIRQSGDKVTMTVASPVYLQLNEEEAAREREAKAKRRAAKAQAKAAKENTATTTSDTNDQPLPAPPPSDEIVADGNAQPELNGDDGHGSNLSTTTDASSDRGRSRQPPPAPPRRDPSTTLTVGRTRARSLCIAGGVSDGASTDSGTGQAGDTSDASSSNQGHKGSRHEQRYDSEGRSTKSSSPTTSIESIVPNGQHAVNGATDKTGSNQPNNKVASIRSRGRRMSAFELEEFFARQDENGADKNKNRSGKDGKVTATTLKKKSKKKSSMTKTYHSTPDIQAELQAELEREKQQTQVNNAVNIAHGMNHKANSQEDVRGAGHVLYAPAETLTLKNGKIVGKDQPGGLPPPPSQTAADGKQNGDVIVKVTDVNGPMSKSDYAQLAAKVATTKTSTSMTSSTLSSFRPASEIATVATASTKGPAPAPPAPADKALKSVKGQLKSSNVNSSVYTRQETIESLDGDEDRTPTATAGTKAGGKPFIPDPDYSSEEETQSTASIGAKRDLSTFKTPTTATNTDATKRDQSSQPPVNGTANGFGGKRQSSVESGGATSSSTSTPSTAKEAPGLRRSSDESSEASGHLPPPPNFPAPDPNAESQMNKVKATIRELERRTSLSSNEGSTAGTTGVRTTQKKQAPLAPTSSTDSNSIRMSKSCFESLDDDRIAGNNSESTQPQSLPCTINNEMSAVGRSQTLNRRNISTGGGPVSERIAAVQTLMSQGHSQSQATTIISAQQQQLSAATGGNQKAAPTTAKTWSEISSAIRAAKPGPPGPTPAQTMIANPQTAQSTARPLSAPNARQMAAKDKALKLHVAGGGHTNEVDVLAELVPPPPEFAAPPPLSGQMSRNSMAPPQGGGQHRVQLQVKAQPGLVGVRQPSPQPVLHQQQMHSTMTKVAGPDGSIRILQPTGQQAPPTHFIQKPKPSPAGPTMAELQQHMVMQQRDTSTPPTSLPPHPQQQPQESLYNTDLTAAARLGINPGAGHSHLITNTGQQVIAISAAQFQSLTPQQQAQYQAYMQQAAKQQFATLGRAYQGQQAKNQQQQQQLTAVNYQGQLAALRSAGDLEPGKQYQIVMSSAGGHGHSHAGGQPLYTTQGYHQFATLSRAGQAAKAAAAAQQQQQQQAINYNDYNRLTVQNRLLRQQQPSPQPQPPGSSLPPTQQQQSILHQQYHQQQQQQPGMPTSQQQPPPQHSIHHPQPMTAQQFAAYQQQQQVAQARYQQQQQLLAHQQKQAQQQQQQQMPVQSIYGTKAMPAAPTSLPPAGPPPSATHQVTMPPPPQQQQQHQPPMTQAQAQQQQQMRQIPAFARKSIVEWQSDDVISWLNAIGMAEHQAKFEGLTGVKLLRVDNNDLIGVGIRQAQHRTYVLEKVKQLLHYQQQHPPH